MSVKQKLLATILTVVFLGMAFYLIFINYGELNLLNDIDQAAHQSDHKYIIHDMPLTKEKYKIINIVYENDEVYAIVYLDNGNIKLIQFHEAYIDPGLKNILEGYLYRENGQIYIKAE